MARAGVAVLAAAALLLVSSCGDGRTDAPAPDPTPSTGSSAPVTAADPEGTPPFPDAPHRQFDPGSGDWDLVLTGVRVGEHPGFDRIVVELTGAGVPGWSVRYVDRPRLEGSGDDVALAGRAFLDISASHTTWPAPGYYDGPTRLMPHRGTAVEEVHVAGTSEGYTQVLAGVRGGPQPFRVFTLTGPTRLVIDVAAPAA